VVQELFRLAFHVTYKILIEILFPEVFISNIHCGQNQYIMGGNRFCGFHNFVHFFIQMTGNPVQTFLFNIAFDAVFLTQYGNGDVFHPGAP
jgi:hypothetical protein